MSKEEKEVKILNVDKDCIITKLEALGAKKINECVQKLYVYDIQSIYTRFLDAKSYLDDSSHKYNDEIALSKLKNVFFELDDLIVSEEKEELKKLTGKQSFTELVDTYDKKTLKEILSKAAIVDAIKKYEINPNKWVRLRETSGETTITIKHIINNNSNKDIQKVFETEMIVPSIEVGNNILNELGFVYRNYQEKERITYILDGVEVDIDTWPMIPTYVEIENEDVTKIQEAIEKLGLQQNEIVSCNTVQVYKRYGIDILSYRELKFKGENNE